MTAKIAVAINKKRHYLLPIKTQFVIVGTSPFSCYQLSSMKDKRRLTFNWCLVREYRESVRFRRSFYRSGFTRRLTNMKPESQKGLYPIKKGQQRELFGEIKMLLRKRPN